MTGRLNALIVVLERDIREDDTQVTISAISQIKGVLNVDQRPVDPSDHIAEMRVRHALQEKLWRVLWDE